MPNDNPESRRPVGREEEAAEYRRRQQIKAQRRKKRQLQRIGISAAFVAAAVLVVVCIVLIIRTVMDPKPKAPKPAASGSLSGSVSAPASASAAGNTGAGVSWPVAADPTVWNLLLVNTQNPVPEGHTFEEGRLGSEGYVFDARITGELERMIADCNAVEGNTLRIISGFRGSQTQNGKHQALVDLYTGEGLEEAAAVAEANKTDPVFGQSDHQTGLAVDFITENVTEPSQAFAETPEYAWLLENARNYGFVLRFPENKADITGINYQPYHFRYVGAEDAKMITEAGICLEEYLAQLPTSPAVDAVLNDSSTPASAPAGGTAAPNSAPPEGDTAG